MKKMFIFVSLFFIPIPLFGLIGRCIDNSNYLQERYDNKKYHFVTCYCNCSDTLKACPSCGHKHMAREQIIIQTTKHDIVAKAAKKTKTINPQIPTTDPHAALTALVKNHKQTK